MTLEEPTPPPVPPVCETVFGDRCEMAERYAAELADTGVTHGLIGPREVPRLWDRHILNCGVIGDSFPEGVTVVDVGSGAGLPGVALALARPDLDVHCVEPMLRRTEWLTAVISSLELPNVTVHRARAQEFAGQVPTRFVTARAVANLGKLATWTRPLLEDEGTLVAMKGERAHEELDGARPILRRLGMTDAVVVQHGTGVVQPPVVTVDVTFHSR